VLSSFAPQFLMLVEHLAFAQTFSQLSRYDLNYIQFLEYCQGIKYDTIKMVMKND
jgi:hypothetical protein